MEDGCVKINRNFEEITFPSEVMLVAAANPCKCGYLWDEKKICRCSSREIDSYQRNLAGPFSDRIDMHIRMLPVSHELISGAEKPAAVMCSAEMKERVESARAIQKRRYSGSAYRDNGSLDSGGVEIFCRLDDECRHIMAAAYEKFALSMRAYTKVIKTARTIADLESSENITVEHVAEALSYRISDWDYRK